MSKRVWKLQEFVAHSGRVHCARLGEKSGQVLATGGDDKRVNIWKIGKCSAMMSLSGQTSAVECCVFDKQEEVLVVGTAGGSMQVWNLEYRKMAGTLTGHRTACNSVEFHPYGEFFASGSADTNLKIWDLRRKSCIQTYKGHTGTINTIRFSPHGRWVATGGQDSQVKIWDLTAGKLMKDLDLHKGAITSLAFHPKEYLLASGSNDRTMKLWSLETFKSVGSTDLGSSSVQAVKFYVEEQAVLSASQDALRVYSTDSLSSPVDVIDVDWRGLQDMRLCLPEDKLMGVSSDASSMSVWVADLDKREAGAVKPSAAGSYSRPLATKASGPTGSAGGPPSSVARAPQARSSSGGPSGDDQESRRSPVLPRPSQNGSSEEPSRPSRLQPETQAQRGSTSPKAFASVPTPQPSDVAAGPPQEAPSAPVRDQAYGSKKREELRPQALEQPSQQVGYSPKALGGQALAPFPEVADSSPVAASAEKDAMPQGSKSPAAPSKPQPSVLDAGADQVSQLALQHPQMMGVLQRRSTQVRRAKDLWAQGNLSSLAQGLQFPQDHAVICDFARAVMREKMVGALNLDACQALLPVMRDLMNSKYEDFALTGHQFAELLLQHFGDLITETRQSCAGIPERQLDLAREERLRKCNACHSEFKEIQKSLAEGRLAGRFVSFRAALQTFLQRC